MKKQSNIDYEYYKRIIELPSTVVTLEEYMQIVVSLRFNERYKNNLNQDEFITIEDARDEFKEIKYELNRELD